ncbi:MAG: molybdate ABC transporter substrate-binding protein [Ilumatobacteraceae bacterium]
MSGRLTSAIAAALGGVVVLFAAACGAGTGAADDEPPETITVAAASDLRIAFRELGEVFTADTGIDVTFSFGSSGQLREQIVNGAPFDLFASANVAFVDDVIAAGHGDVDTKADYALGRIALWAPPGVEPPASIDELADPRYGSVAIANPEHAPYGLAAEQALASAGVLDEVADRLVYGENISDTLRIARSGNVDVGIIALSLVIAADDPYVLVPEHLHEPLRQALVVTGEGAAGVAAARFVDLVASDSGREVMNRFGFALPGERLRDDE